MERQIKKQMENEVETAGVRIKGLRVYLLAARRE